MCVTPGAQVKTSKKYVLLIGLFGAAVWLLPLVLSAIELKAYTDGERIKTIYNQQVPHFLTRDYAIAGVALSGIYILPSLLMILGVLTKSNTIILPWLVIAMIYMTGKIIFQNFDLYCDINSNKYIPIFLSNNN